MRGRGRGRWHVSRRPHSQTDSPSGETLLLPLASDADSSTYRDLSSFPPHWRRPATQWQCSGQGSTEKHEHEKVDGYLLVRASCTRRSFPRLNQMHAGTDRHGMPMRIEWAVHDDTRGRFLPRRSWALRSLCSHSPELRWRVRTLKLEPPQGRRCHLAVVSPPCLAPRAKEKP